MIVKRARRSRPHLRRAIVRRSGLVTVGERNRAPAFRGGGGVIGNDDAPPRRPWHWRPRKRWIVLAAMAVAFAGLGTGGYYAMRAPYFDISEVTVAGTRRLDTQELAAQSGLAGESMFSADLAAAHDALMATPLVKSAHIERNWPHGVRITIEERQPWGTWEQAGVKYTIDREGVVLGDWDLPAGGPVIRSALPTSLRAGDRVDYQAVDATAEIYEQLPKVVGIDVSEVAFVPGKGVQVTTGSGQVALLGDSSSIAYKLAAWSAVAKEADRRGFAYTTIDLRFGNRPVVQ